MISSDNSFFFGLAPDISANHAWNLSRMTPIQICLIMLINGYVNISVTEY